jgi:glyoxylase-like metal-dependent hydrolase (beta-lactamase superfamily II)
MKIHPIIASTFRSDGGSMFGLVPRPIWAKRIPPDERHRIPQNANVLLIELDDGRIGLVDTGCGSAAHFTEREAELHGLGPGWPLMERLLERGIHVDDIAFVLYTHLHWDHAGGSVSGGTLTFPRATHFIHELEWRDATSGDPLLYKSYPVEIGRSLEHARKVLVTDARPDILPGIRMLRSGGHTRGHCAIHFEDPFAVFAGDLCPTRHHLRMVFQTSYDTYPLDTRAWKRAWLPQLADRKGRLYFDHDPDVAWATLTPDPREEFVVAESHPAGAP